MKKIALILVVGLGLSGGAISSTGLNLSENNKEQLLIDTIVSVGAKVLAPVAHAIFGAAGNSLDQNELVLDEANQDKLLLDTIVSVGAKVLAPVASALFGALGGGEKNSLNDEELGILQDEIANELENMGFDLE